MKGEQEWPNVSAFVTLWLMVAAACDRSQVREGTAQNTTGTAGVGQLVVWVTG